MTSPDPTIAEVADGVWAYIQPDGGWMVNNMGLVEGADGNTTIDVTSTELRTRRYLSEAQRVTGREIQRLILTHAHPDHCLGGSLLPDVEVIAHHAAAEDLRASSPGAPGVFEPFVIGDVHARVPTLEIDDTLTVREAGRDMVLRHPGVSAHTPGDLYVWLPESRVLFAGDLVFNAGTPFVLAGSPRGWLTALEQLAALDPAVVVPGHGPVGGSELLEPVADYLRFLMDAAQVAVADGLGPLEAAQRLDLGRFAGLIDPERIAGNMHRAIGELRGTPVDARQAFQDMYVYNGNKPLTVDA